MDITGKVAIVTGGASGIGLSIIKELLRNGAKGIVMADFNETIGVEVLLSLEEEFKEGSVVFLKTDISKKESFEEAFKTTLDKFNQLDIVVNNAGIMNDVDYLRCIETNLIGTTHGIKLGLKYMSKQEGGQGGIIINIASIAVWEMIHTCPAYSATKAGIIQLTRGFGHSFHHNKTKVKVMALCPGPTITPIHKNCKFLDGCYAECVKVNPNIEFHMQPVAVARTLIYILKKGETAQVFLADKNKLYLINEPQLHKCKELVLDQI